MHTQDAPAWIYSPLPGQVRWSTMATCALTFAVVAWAGAVPGESWWMRPVRGLVAAMVALCGFEIAYQLTGAAIHRWSLSTLTLTVAGTGGWIGWAYVSLRMRPNWWLLGAFALVWVAWATSGFASNMPDRIIPGAALRWDWTAELLNVSAKALLAAAVAVGALGLGAQRDVDQQWAQGGAGRPETADAHLQLGGGDQPLHGGLHGGDMLGGS